MKRACSLKYTSRLRLRDFIYSAQTSYRNLRRENLFVHQEDHPISRVSYDQIVAQAV
jgi:hypothetical protein